MPRPTPEWVALAAVVVGVVACVQGCGSCGDPSSQGGGSPPAGSIGPAGQRMLTTAATSSVSPNLYRLLDASVKDAP
jgi:hypothetical protein